MSNGTDLNYTRTQVADQNVTLSNIHIANPFFVARNATNTTILKFGLIVDDDTISSSPAYVDVEVKPQQSKNNTLHMCFQ
jgi:hypothetical protein